MPNRTASFTARTLLLAACVGSGHAGAAGHCDKGEVTYFSCKLSHSAKVVSLCGGRLTDPATQAVDPQRLSTMWLQYRFGKANTLELVFPSQVNGSLSRFKGEYHTGQSVSSSTVIFSNGNATYTVGTSFSALTSIGFDGVDIAQKGKRIALACDGKPAIDRDFGELVQQLEPVK